VPQLLYERARKAVADRRVYVGEELVNTLHHHGLAGVFIDPEQILRSSLPRRSLTGPKAGTAFHRAHLTNDAFVTLATSLAEGVGISSTARIQQVDKKTVLLVLARASEHATQIHRTLLHDLDVSECQLDELWSFVGKKEKNLDPLEKLLRIFGDAWTWVAFDAVNKVFLATVTGKRTLPHAVTLLQEVKRITSRMPMLFSSDQLDHYANALLQVYGHTVYPPRKSGRGRRPHPKLIPPPELLYVQVVKHYQGNRVVKIDRKVIFGNPESVDQILTASPISNKINTSYVERGNGIIRHVDARFNRKTFRFSKRKLNHERQLSLSLAYYHLCRPHKTLSRRYKQPTTPFMAAGITDHVWTMRDLLGFRI
jgi:IS1 family transposase